MPITGGLPPLTPPGTPPLAPFFDAFEMVAPGLNTFNGALEALGVIPDVIRFASLLNQIDSLQDAYGTLASYQQRSDNILAQLFMLTEISGAIHDHCDDAGLPSVFACVEAVSPVNAAALLLAGTLRRIGPALVAEQAANFSVGVGQTVTLDPPLDFEAPGVSGFIKDSGALEVAGKLVTSQFLGLGVTATGIRVGPTTAKLLEGGVIAALDTWISEGASLIGNGTITGTVANLGGTIAPGNSPGTLSIGGDLHFLGGLLDIELGGLGPSQFDLLTVGGAANFQGGTIRFSFIDNFLPLPGDRFEFLVADAGIFLDPALVSLEVATPFEPGFRVFFEASRLFFEAGGSPSATPAPEPATLVLFASGLFGLSLITRRRRARSESGKKGHCARQSLQGHSGRTG